LEEPVEHLSPKEFLLTVSRARGYKNASAVEAAAELLGATLVVVGGSAEPSSGRIRRLGRVPDSQLRWLYRNAEALVGASNEDFGLTPIEANAFGTPSVLWRNAGYTESTTEGVNGVFFEQPEAGGIAEAVRKLRAAPLDERNIVEASRAFTPSAFVEAIRREMSAVLD
jgi:glycosyltransferase involved in cell wall biosynthesis